MPAQIDSIVVKGYNGNGNVKRGRRVPNQTSAHQRFNNLKANLIEISGRNLNQLTERQIKITYSTGGHDFAVLELVARDTNTKLDVYFVVWSPENAVKNVGKKDELDLGDLTVTVETVDVTPTTESGTDDNVTIED